MAQVVESLPSKGKDLILNPSSTKKQEQTKIKESQG
jgi:hypothetical protein